MKPNRCQRACQVGPTWIWHLVTAHATSWRLFCRCVPRADHLVSDISCPLADFARENMDHINIMPKRPQRTAKTAKTCSVSSCIPSLLDGWLLQPESSLASPFAKSHKQGLQHSLPPSGLNDFKAGKTTFHSTSFCTEVGALLVLVICEVSANKDLSCSKSDHRITSWHVVLRQEDNRAWTCMLGFGLAHSTKRYNMLQNAASLLCCHLPRFLKSSKVEL